MLAEACDYLERALSQATTRAEEHAIGERICELLEMQELEECRQLRTRRLRVIRNGLAFPVETLSACA